jgi:hypothetical protein
MSLVNQFQITLKDVWPDHGEATVINNRDRGGTTTTLSKQLYTKLRAYADDNRLPLEEVVQQLRDKIHRS